MPSLPERVRAACAQVAARARFVEIRTDQVPLYAAALPSRPPDPDPEASMTEGDAEARAAFAIQLDAINFGSGWFPTLRKRPGRSGYYTVAIGFRQHGPFEAAELTRVTAAELAQITGQDPDHELMRLFADSLHDLGRHVLDEHGGSFMHVVEQADGSAVRFAETLAAWECFADVSPYGDLEVPFYKRAQIAASSVRASGVAQWRDEHELTLFADNLVPHVLRLDGILDVDPGVVARIEGEELIEHDSPEEVELRACALTAVDLIVEAHGDTTASDVDWVLWTRGQSPRYKARPRHRARTTAY